MRADRNNVVEFPISAEGAARRFQREMERIARSSAIMPRINRQIRDDYHRLVLKIQFPGNEAGK